MLGRPRITLDDVPSTMEVTAMLAARGATEGTTVVARHQSAGRGRANRTWVAAPGTALLCSVLLRPGRPLADLTPMSVLVADSIAAAVRRLHGLGARIKWPNDVLVGDRKICGVLIQTRSSPGGLAMIVGFGVNTQIPASDLPEGATSIVAEGATAIDHDALLATVMDELAVRYRDLMDGQAGTHLARIGDRLAMRGEEVEVRDGERVLRGLLRGIDADGALLLDTGGQMRRVVVGDVVRGPRRIDAASS